MNQEKPAYKHLQEEVGPNETHLAPGYHPQAMQMNPPVMVQPQPTVYTSTTTVVNQQPLMRRPWTSGVCDCFDDMAICCLMYWFGNCYLGCVASRMGENCCVGCGLPGLWPMRSAFRERHQIEGDLCNDCCSVHFCGPCVACQLAREMDKLGYPNNGC